LLAAATRPSVVAARQGTTSVGSVSQGFGTGLRQLRMLGFLVVRKHAVGGTRKVTPGDHQRGVTGRGPPAREATLVSATSVLVIRWSDVLPCLPTNGLTPVEGPFENTRQVEGCV